MFPPAVGDEASPPRDPQVMMVKVLRKYRKGIHTMFDFYRKANAGTVKQATFDQRREEHGGVNLVMFRRMCKDLNLIYDPRCRFASGGEGHNSLDPFVTREEIDAIFKRHAQHLKRVSSISHGRGVLNEAQFAASCAQVAIMLLREQPWSKVYTEDWHRIDAIFSRLDVNNNVLLRKRLRGLTAFSSGDGDLQGRNETSRNSAARGLSGPTAARSGFTYPLRRSPNEPKTPPRGDRRRRRKGNGSSSNKGSDGGGSTGQNNANKTSNNSPTSDGSCGGGGVGGFAGVGGGDDWLNGNGASGGSGGKAQVVSNRGWTLDGLSLTYGLESSRLNRGPGQRLWLDDDAGSRKSWEDMEADAASQPVKPTRPQKGKGRLPQGQSPRLTRSKR